MKHTYTFTLILGNSPPIDGEIAHNLFDAGCDDALPGVRHGVSIIDFDRQANSFRDAVISAIRDVEKVDDLRVTRIEPDDLVSMSEIARRSNRTRENIGQFVRGTRGPKNFPAPIRAIANKSPLWSWAKVSKWMVDNTKLGKNVAIRAQEIISLNTEIRQLSQKTESSQMTAVLIVPFHYSAQPSLQSRNIRIESKTLC